MRIALLADIHGNLAALEAVERDFSARGVDAVVNLGDSLSGPLLPRETADHLMARNWIQIAGNHERQLLSASSVPPGASDAYTLSQLTSSQCAWIASLASTRTLGEDVFLCHGTPASDHAHFLATVEPGGLRDADPEEMERRLGNVAASLVACGHTHIPRGVRSRRGQLIVNPGSVGLQAYLDDDPGPYRVETGSPEARYAIVEKGQGGWSVEWFQVPYDAEAMAELARLRGFRTWEWALLRGCLPQDA